MRKPNYGEAAYEFAELKQAMKREGFPQYAAFCALAVARCEQALSRTPQEAAQYRDAGTSRPRLPAPPTGRSLSARFDRLVSQLGRLFAAAERDIQSFVFASDGSTLGFEENYAEALDCYRLAIEVCDSRACPLRVLWSPVPTRERVRCRVVRARPSDVPQVGQRHAGDRAVHRARVAAAGTHPHPTPPSDRKNEPGDRCLSTSICCCRSSGGWTRRLRTCAQAWCS